MKSGVLVIVLLFVGFVYCQSSPCDAIPIVIETGGNATEYGNNNNMPRFAPSLCNRGASGTVWYSIQPEAGQNVLITTCGSYTQFDTILGVYSGSCDNLVCEEFSEDARCPASYDEYWYDDDEYYYRSTVSFASTGETFYISVSGDYTQASGNFELTVAYSDISDSACANAIDVPGDYYSTVLVNGTLGNSRVGLSVCDEFKYYDRGTWFKIHPEPNHKMNISTCSYATNFDTRLAIVAAPDCGSTMDCIDENDDDYCPAQHTWELSSISFLPTLSEYFVILASFDDDEGEEDNYVISFRQSNAGQNIACVDAYPLNIGTTGSPEGSTVNGIQLTEAICSNEYGDAIWYKVVSHSDANIKFTTCNSVTNFDTTLSVYSGACYSLQCVTYNDDDSSCSVSNTLSTVEVSLTANEPVYLIISGYNGATGTYRLDYSNY